MSVRPIPAGYHTITPFLVVQDADKAMAFYQEAFGAVERLRISGPDGQSVLHGLLRIGDSIFMVGTEMPAPECKSPAS
jgi:PhnB protein